LELNDKVIFALENISISFGGLRAVDDCSFEIRDGEIFSLIGPNGAGKTTIFNIINALYKPDSGHVLLEGEDIVSLKPHQIAKRGIARTFQNIELFSEMSVLENILVGRHFFFKSGVLANSLAFGNSKSEEARNIETASEIISFLELDEYENQKVTDLSFGIQKRVELARAMALNPNDFSGRTRHAPGDGAFRPNLCATLRCQNRRGNSGGHPKKPQSYRSILRNYKTQCLKSNP
jgi:branched-chain amino acid transport system ATP-binding protein